MKIMDWEVGSSGYAAVWAKENTRASIWDAMQRKETYATTGPRMIVRFFGGWDFEAKDADNRLPAQIGYTKGVPMGGDLRAAPRGKSPTFLVAALKDPIGANLDRYQIIKGWLDKDGNAAREDLRRRVVGRPQAGQRRQASVGRQHRGRGERDLDQHDRRARADHGVEGPGLRPEPARLLLRTGDRDSDPALDRLRRQTIRGQAAAGHRHDHHRARLHLADLVHAGEVARQGGSMEIAMGFRKAILQPRLVRSLMFGTFMLCLAAGSGRLRLSR